MGVFAIGEADDGGRGRGVEGADLEPPCEVHCAAMYNLALLPFVFCCGPSGLRLVVKG